MGSACFLALSRYFSARRSSLVPWYLVRGRVGVRVRVRARARSRARVRVRVRVRVGYRLRMASSRLPRCESLSRSRSSW